MQKSVEFEYLYRDSGNYKYWNSLVFAGSTGMRLQEAEKRIRLALDSGELFIASQIYVPEMFPFLEEEPTEDDHCFHEFSSLRFTSLSPTDGHSRSIEEFVKQIEDAARTGWIVFDPAHTVN